MTHTYIVYDEKMLQYILNELKRDKEARVT